MTTSANDEERRVMASGTYRAEKTQLFPYYQQKKIKNIIYHLLIVRRITIKKQLMDSVYNLHLVSHTLVLCTLVPQIFFYVVPVHIINLSPRTAVPRNTLQTFKQSPLLNPDGHNQGHDTLNGLEALFCVRCAFCKLLLINNQSLQSSQDSKQYHNIISTLFYSVLCLSLQSQLYKFVVYTLFSKK